MPNDETNAATAISAQLTAMDLLLKGLYAIHAHEQSDPINHTMQLMDGMVESVNLLGCPDHMDRDQYISRVQEGLRDFSDGLIQRLEYQISQK